MPRVDRQILTERIMKRSFTALALAIVAIVFTGCALTEADNTITTHEYLRPDGTVEQRIITKEMSNDAANYDANARIEETITDRVGKVLDRPCNTDSAEARGYCEGSKTLAAVMMGQKVVQIPRGPSWVDWALRGWQTADNLIPVAGMSFLGYEGIKNSGKNVSVAGKTVDIRESFNPFEAHSTGSSESPVSIPFRPTTTETTTTGITTTTGVLP